MRRPLNRGPLNITMRSCFLVPSMVLFSTSLSSYSGAMLSAVERISVQPEQTKRGLEYRIPRLHFDGCQTGLDKQGSSKVPINNLYG